MILYEVNNFRNIRCTLQTAHNRQTLIKHYLMEGPSQILSRTDQ